MSEIKILSEKTFYANDIGDENSDHLIYVLHGYGQLSRYFIKKFEDIQHRAYIVAPEGMHRFYNQGTEGRVGASWMTKENREDDINDNIHWLNDLHAHLTTNRNYKRITIIGFSQGGATAVRWLTKGVIFSANLILWGSIFPPDVPFDKQITNKIKYFKFVVGDKDPYFTNQNDNQKLKKEMEDLGAKVIIFSGEHDIDTITLMQIIDEIDNNIS